MVKVLHDGVPLTMLLCSICHVSHLLVPAGQSAACGEHVMINICAKMEAKFFRFLKIVGVGFKARAEAEGRLLYLKLGYSHEVELTVPPAVRVFCFKNNVVCCTGIDKERVHQFAAAIRSSKPPEVYKGKGIMYIDEVIKKKDGKRSK